MKQMPIVLGYLFKNADKIISAEEINQLVDFSNCNISEINEIYESIVKHNEKVIIEHQKLLKEVSQLPVIKPFNPHQQVEKKNSKKEEENTPNIICTYLNYFKGSITDEDIERVLDEINASPYKDQIISTILLQLNSEKSSIIKMMHTSCSDEDLAYLKAEMQEIDAKIESIETYSIEEDVITPEISKEKRNVVLFRLPSGNIALKKDLDTIMANLYHDAFYYQDIIELLESVRSGNFIDPKKLSGVGEFFEDRNGQCRITFVLCNNMCIITSIFIKKSMKENGIYTTLRGRAKLFNKVKNDIIPNETDDDIIEDMITTLRTSIGKKVQND